jgi:hypothetical protein
MQNASFAYFMTVTFLNFRFKWKLSKWSICKTDLESAGGVKICNIFGGQKLANTCSFEVGSIIMQQEEISRAEILLQNLKN